MICDLLYCVTLMPGTDLIQELKTLIDNDHRTSSDLELTEWPSVLCAQFRRELSPERFRVRFQPRAIEQSDSKKKRLRDEKDAKICPNVLIDKVT